MKENVVSVIICTKNRLGDFQKTVISLTKQNRPPDELVVVDSSDDSSIQDFVTGVDLPFPIRYVRAPLGLTRARNIGIQNSSGDLLFFFDDDVDLEVNYLKHAEQVFASDARMAIGAVGGRITNVFQSEPVAGWIHLKRIFFEWIRFIFLLSKLGSGKFRYSGMPSLPHAQSTSRYIECLSGGCMAFRRRVFERIQFNEDLIGYGHVEDADISKQVLNAGYKIYFEASAQLKHYPSPQDRSEPRKLAELTVVNYAHYFQRRWPQTLLRKIAFGWSLIGLGFVFARGGGWLGVVSGVRKVFFAGRPGSPNPKMPTLASNRIKSNFPANDGED